MRLLRCLYTGLLVSVLTGLIARAEPPPDPRAPDPNKAISQYLHSVWDIDDGLPQNTVSALLQTRDGYLWLGTEEGLVRFDGSVFEVFDKGHTPAFEQGHDVEVLLEGADGTLWIGTFDGGLIQGRGTEMTAFTPPGLAGRSIHALAEDAAGNLWVGTADAGLFRCTRTACDAVGAATALAGRRIKALLNTADGTLWIGTDAGLFSLRGDALTAYTEADGLPNNFVLTLYEDSHGILCIGTRGGLAKIKEGVLEAKDPADGWPDEPVWALWEDATGSLWMGLDRRGLLRRHRGRTDGFTPDDGLTQGRVLSLFMDREGNLWIGTETGGLNRLRDALITTYTTSQGLPSNAVLSVHEDAAGILWIGTEDGSLSRLPTRDANPTLRQERRFNSVVSSVLGQGATLWVGTQGEGLHRRAGGAWQVLTAEQGLPSDYVYALHVGQASGDLWIGTDAGVARYQDGAFTTVTVDDGLSSNYVTVLHEDTTGALWIGTFDGGLNRYDKGSVSVYAAADVLGSDVISALYEDAEGTLWIGTYGGGLIRYRDGRFARFTPKHGLFNDKIYQILEDADGFLWMGCNLGLFRVEKAALDAVADGRRSSVTSFVFDTENGLRSREINGGVQPAGWRSRDGRLWFPTAFGLSVVDPVARQHNANPPPVVIEALHADGQPMPLEPGLELMAGTEVVTFDFTALSLVDPGAVRFRYFLEGDDPAWSDATDQRDVRYTHLDPGTYTFRVIAMNNDGVWNEAGTSFTFYLRPYLWQTAWFWLLTGLAFVGGGVGGYRWRIRTLKTRQRHLEHVVAERTQDLRMAKEQIETQAEALRVSLDEKEVLLREIHHRVKNNLQIISSLLHLQGQQVQDPATLQLFKESRARILSMSMIHERLYSSDNLANLDFGAYLRSITEQLFRSYTVHEGIELRVQTDPAFLKVDQAIPCGLIVNELVSNALKHAFPEGRTGWIAVTFADEGQHFRLVVEDNGIGVPPGFTPAQGRSLGLKLVQALVAKLQGCLDVCPNREASSGTRFELVFPVDDAEPEPAFAQPTYHQPVES